MPGPKSKLTQAVISHKSLLWTELYITFEKSKRSSMLLPEAAKVPYEQRPQHLQGKSRTGVMGLVFKWKRKTTADIPCCGWQELSCMESVSIQI